MESQQQRFQRAIGQSPGQAAGGQDRQYTSQFVVGTSGMYVSTDSECLRKVSQVVKHMQVTVLVLSSKKQTLTG